MHKDYFYVLATVNNTAVNAVHKYPLETLPSVVVGIYAELDLFNHVVILFLIWGECRTVLQFHQQHPEFPVSPYSHHSFSLFLIVAILVGVVVFSLHVPHD